MERSLRNSHIQEIAKPEARGHSMTRVLFMNFVKRQ